MHFPGNPDALSMFAESETRFFFTVRDEIIEFQNDPDGSVARLLIRSAGSEQVARRVRHGNERAAVRQLIRSETKGISGTRLASRT